MIYTTIKRVFHPIGQGAFYSERHDNYNIVYDCGEWKNSKESTRLVENSFSSNSVIHMLFISHFDFDHVSKIDVLKNNFTIQICILPLLSDEQKKIMTAFYKSLDKATIPNFDTLIALINNPEKYFKAQTKIIYVKPVSKENKSNEEDIVSPILDDLLKSNSKFKNGTIIESGTQISINHNWIYMPYNINYSQRKKELEDIFATPDPETDECLDISEFINNIDYALKNRSTIKKIYDKLQGKINLNSMLLYSGPPLNKQSTLLFSDRLYGRCYHFPTSWSNECNIWNKPACIFTGDANLNFVDIKEIFHDYWNYVGTIQLPHHGAESAFAFALLKDDENFIFPVSYGRQNTYGHPSDNVMIEIASQGSCVVHITESKETLYIQAIRTARSICS